MEKEEILLNVNCRNWRYVSFILILAILNMFMFSSFMIDKHSWLACLRVSSMLFFFLTSFVGIFWGIIIAFLPYKGLKYREKYLRTSLLSILCIQALIAVSYILDYYRLGITN